MRNILFLHSSAELYGSDRSLLNLVKNLDKSRYRVFVVLPVDGPLIHEMQKIDGVEVSIFPIAVLRRKNLSIRGGFRYIKEYRKTKKFLKKFILEHDIDIVETNTSVVFSGAVVAKKMGKKSIWHVREIISSNFENKVISRVMNRYADVIVANSKATGAALKVDFKKIRVVYNAVEDFQTKEKKVPALGRAVVGMAGRINRWKGQKLFVDMAREVYAKYPKAEFLMAGDVYIGEDFLKEELVEKIKNENLGSVVKLLGRVENMDEFYKKIDIFVLPSIKPEPFGLVIIEAMLRGVPVVATKHGGPVEIIKNGETGFLVDFEDPKEMSSVVMKLISDPECYKKISKAAMEEAKRKYTTPVMIKAMEKIYDEV